MPNGLLPPTHFWLLSGSSPSGPFNLEQIRGKLASGEITVASLACPLGGNQWASLAALLPTIANQATLLPTSPVGYLEGIEARRPASSNGGRAPISSPETSAPAWHPMAIAALGLLFTPVWAGVMAAVNAYRLKAQLPAGRPVTFGVIWLILTIFNGLLFDSYWIDVLLYSSALGLIATLDLWPQLEAFAQPGEQRRGAGWLVPSLAGAPLAVLVVLGFVIAPLIPLEPREICQRFADASTKEQAKQYTTINLWPALTTLFKAQPEAEQFLFEITGEEWAPLDVGGYCVGHRMLSKKDNARVEGIFHLVWRDGQWKIEDVYFTEVNNQPLESWISVARDYQLLAAAANDAQVAVNASVKPVFDPRDRNRANTTKSAADAGRGLGLLIGAKGAKGVGLAVVAVAVAVIAGLRRVLLTAKKA